MLPLLTLPRSPSSLSSLVRWSTSLASPIMGSLSCISFGSHFSPSPNLAHLLHRPQLKQYYRWKNNVLVRQNYERKAHWNELFFDLVFICVFQRVAHELHSSEQLDGRALTEFCVLFCAAWKIWFDLTVYVNQFDPVDTLHKIYFLMQMIFVMGLAVMSIKGVIGSYLAGTGGDVDAEMLECVLLSESTTGCLRADWDMGGSCYPLARLSHRDSTYHRWSSRERTRGLRTI